ncbi:hypothetical protein CBOM_07962 [Ceraceosorus bombacis]|uniref:Uncharacterized protein n=1 Tax=Ceraceosorus bombacis TaxID=401625 RepID=A0A0P1BRS2_9BASI|nr:hypothetical protein CBOM_07962 [Ceraceosorus bombacis]
MNTSEPVTRPDTAKGKLFASSQLQLATQSRRHPGRRVKRPYLTPCAKLKSSQSACTDEQDGKRAHVHAAEA